MALLTERKYAGHPATKRFGSLQTFRRNEPFVAFDGSNNEGKIAVTTCDKGGLSDIQSST